MNRSSSLALSLALTLVLATPFASAQRPDQGRPGAERAAPARPGAGRPQAHGQPYAGPSRYHQVTPPKGWNNRPAAVSRPKYQHNFQAQRTFRIGPYVRPPGWVARHWVYGQILPPAYWAAEYLIGDYWLFGLQVPPVGYEWVRDDDDAILVDTANGEILQVVYGVFG